MTGREQENGANFHNLVGPTDRNHRDSLIEIVTN